MIALTTAVIAARSARGKRAVPGRGAGRQEASRIGGRSREDGPLLGEQLREDGGLAVVRGAADERAERRAVAARPRRPGSASAARSASTRAASTNCGSFSSTSDCSGVVVTSRLAVQTSRDIASKVTIDGGGERAPPERVEAAAIELVAGVLRVGLAGAGLLPEAGRLIRLDARTADASRLSRPLAASALSRICSASSRCFGPRASSALSGSRAASSAGARDDCRNVARRHDQAVQRLDVPAALHERRRPASRAARDASAAGPGCRNPPASRPGRGRSACARSG